MALPTGLLANVKNFLDITWADVDMETKLTGIIERGMSRINSYAGVSDVPTNPEEPEGTKGFDFTVEDKPRELLLEYCRYAWANALNKFEENYLSEIIYLQNREEAKAYAAETADTDV